MGLFSNSPEPALSFHLARIERKLDAIIEQLDIKLPEADGWDDVRELVAAGKKINAIKLYRQRTGASLADAKAAVDALC